MSESNKSDLFALREELSRFQKLYSEAVKGRQDFRKALRECRAELKKMQMINKELFIALNKEKEKNG